MLKPRGTWLISWSTSSGTTEGSNASARRLDSVAPVKLRCALQMTAQSEGAVRVKDFVGREKCGVRSARRREVEDVRFRSRLPARADCGSGGARSLRWDVELQLSRVIGQIYDEARYETNGKFSNAKFENTNLRECAETFKTVCFDGAYCNFTARKMAGDGRAGAADFGSG